MLPDENGHEVPGVLYDAVVNESWRQAIGAYQLEDGRSILCSVPLSDEELAIYKSSPDTFFGIVKCVSKNEDVSNLWICYLLRVRENHQCA
jgi:hypothetical protein